MEIHPRFGPGRPERQQGVERRAAAVSAAAQFQPAGGGQKSAARHRRPETRRRRQHPVHGAQRTQPGAESPRGGRAPGGADPRRPGRAEDPQEDAPDQGLAGTAHRIEKAARRHQIAAAGGRAGTSQDLSWIAASKAVAHCPRVTCRMLWRFAPTAPAGHRRRRRAAARRTAASRPRDI